MDSRRRLLPNPTCLLLPRKTLENNSRAFKHKNSLQSFSRYKQIKPGVVKGHWTTSEDNEILSLVGQYGKAWAKISGILKTRNGKQIRDRFINVLDPKIAKKSLVTKKINY